MSTNDEAVARLADRVWKELLSNSPIFGTYLGMEVDDGALDDISEEARLAERARWEAAARDAAAIGDEDLSVDARITRELIRVGASIAIERDDRRMDLLGAVDHMEGVQTLLPQLASFQDASTPERLATFLRRLAAFPRFMDQHLERVREAERLGLTASRISVERLIAQLEGLVRMGGERSPPIRTSPSSCAMSRSTEIRDAVSPRRSASRTRSRCWSMKRGNAARRRRNVARRSGVDASWNDASCGRSVWTPSMWSTAPRRSIRRSSRSIAIEAPTRMSSRVMRASTERSSSPIAAASRAAASQRARSARRASSEMSSSAPSSTSIPR